MWGIPVDSTCIERKIVKIVGGGGGGGWSQCVEPVKTTCRVRVND